MLLAWLTDIHLNFLKPQEIGAFFESLREVRADAIMLTGDVSDARDIADRLEQLAATVERPFYFVLGNHDFYGGSIRGVRAEVRAACLESANLHYLTAGEPVEVAPGVGLVGHDGW